MFSHTTRGVPPREETSSTWVWRSAGTLPPFSFTYCSMASLAPLRTLVPSGRSTPLIRVWAVNSRKLDPAGSTLLSPRRRASSRVDLPSGVSSWRLVRAAQRIRSLRLAPSTGKKSAAKRLPKVMVPVLSRIMVSTSPQASTALPLMAMTLKRVTRSMPAMPMADSRPPMVVGIKQTSRAIRVETGICTPLYTAKGYMVTTTIRKMMVRDTSRVFSAISLGVFLRLAPSTRAIIRSRKLLPGSEVMRIFSQSDTSVVPPVTEQKSPPLSRTTGADSPVMADSSTEAMPSMTSPSPGMTSPATTRTMSPFFSSLERTMVSLPSSWSRWASVSFCVFFRLAAWALPRPSATASAKLANSTVMNRITHTMMS